MFTVNLYVNILGNIVTDSRKTKQFKKFCSAMSYAVHFGYRHGYIVRKGDKIIENKIYETPPTPKKHYKVVHASTSGSCSNFTSTIEDIAKWLQNCDTLNYQWIWVEDHPNLNIGEPPFYICG